MEWSRREGIGGVLAFIFDGRFALEGAQSYDMFKSVTERILATWGRRVAAANTPWQP